MGEGERGGELDLNMILVVVVTVVVVSVVEAVISREDDNSELLSIISC